MSNAVKGIIDWTTNDADEDVWLEKKTRGCGKEGL